MSQLEFLLFPAWKITAKLKVYFLLPTSVSTFCKASQSLILFEAVERRLCAYSTYSTRVLSRKDSWCHGIVSQHREKKSRLIKQHAHTRVKAKNFGGFNVSGFRDCCISFVGWKLKRKTTRTAGITPQLSRLILNPTAMCRCARMSWWSMELWIPFEWSYKRLFSCRILPTCFITGWLKLDNDDKRLCIKGHRDCTTDTKWTDVDYLWFRL